MKAQKLHKVTAPKLKLKTKGYVNLITRNRVEIKKGKVIIYKSRTLLKLAIEAKKAKEKFSKLFNQSFAQSAILESSVLLAKQAIKEGKKHILTSIEHFALHVNLLKAYKHLNSFKYSLPRLIRINLF